MKSRPDALRGPFRAGDLLWIDFDPQLGSEQAGRRPALVVSVDDYNRRSRLIVCCPITTKIKNYTFEVRLPPASSVSGGITGAVLVDQVRSVDWKERHTEYAGEAAPEVLEEVRYALAGLLRCCDHASLRSGSSRLS